ncbi:unnamed protein product [Cylicostephanus goldi]|uniref:UGGT thioredoxin-like domain-containing protein n=1 Tax=Cylicostephanus goldi TaxID=71465 RepID=A0A3P6PN03_CYLGO|nr:unnamed protein product [Cylicostephanus goldi]
MKPSKASSSFISLLHPKNLTDHFAVICLYIRSNSALVSDVPAEAQRMHASQRIVNEGAYHALDTLKELSQNFPTHARSIARESVSRELRQGIELNQKEHLSDAGHETVPGLSPGESMLFLNGIGLDVDSLDMFQLVDTIKQEERVASGFSNMGFQREYLSILTGMEFSEEKGRYAVDYRDADLVYLNNLDTDKRYKHWRNSVKLLLEPYYPGMIRPIARNLFNLIFVVDPAERNSRNLMQIAYSFFKHEIPLRIGLIFVVNDDKKVSGLEDTGVAILNLFNFLAIDSTNHEALKIVNEMLDQFRTQDDIDPADIKSWFEENYSDADYKDVFGPNTDYDRGKTGGMEFLRKSAIGKAPKVLLNGYPLDDAGITGDKFEETVMMEVMRITPKLQTAVINGEPWFSFYYQS